MQKDKNWQIWGINTKTFSVAVPAAGESTPLTVNRHIGLPPNAVIYSIQCRSCDGRNQTDINGKLLGRQILDQGQLSLLDGNGQTLLKDIPLLSLINSSQISFLNIQYMLTWFKPIKASEIDWQSSNVSASYNATGLDTKAVVEFTIYYSCYPEIDFIKHFQHYQSNIKNLGLRSAMLLVSPENSGDTTIYLSKNSSIGIPSDAILVGINFLNSDGLRSIEGKLLPSFNNRGKTFLILKYGNEIVLDGLPYQHAMPQQLGLNYIPVPAILSEEIDWQGSYLQLPQGTDTNNNESYQIILYFVCNNRNSL